MTSCWVCGQPITNPPEIIGQWHATSPRVAHRHCLRILGELDLELDPPTAERGPGPHPRTVPDRHA